MRSTDWLKKALAAGLGVFIALAILAALEFISRRIDISKYSYLVPWHQRQVRWTPPLQSSIHFSIPVKESANQMIDPLAQKPPPAKAPNEKSIHYSGMDETSDGGLLWPRAGQFHEQMFWKKDGRKYYDVTYTIDGEHRRVIPGVAKRDVFAVFYGCSFTFGEGLNDQETLPFYFSKASQVFQPFNEAYRGNSINDVIARLQRGPVHTDMPRKGIGIYVFIDPHVSRALGYLTDYSWTRKRPYYFRDSSQIVSKGTFAQTSALRDILLLLMGKSELLKFFRVEWPLYTTEDDLTLFADLILKAKQEFQDKYNKQPFVVAFHPLFAEFWPSRLIPLLEEREINYLDYSGLALQKYTRKSVQIPIDGHPSAEGNRLWAKQLAADLDSWYKSRARYEQP